MTRHDPARGEQAFDAIARTGREAMAQLRATVGALRDAPREPQPGLADLPELVRHSKSPSLSTKLTETGPRRDLPPAVQLAVYRMVQEALTNVVKHSRAQHVDVLLQWAKEEFTVSVRDDGVGRAPGSEGGNGLGNIRERVAAAGGSIEFANGAKGFQVAAAFR